MNQDSTGASADTRAPQAMTDEHRWGEPISLERARELDALLQAWAEQDEAGHGTRRSPFDSRGWNGRLTGADVYYLATAASAEVQIEARGETGGYPPPGLSVLHLECAVLIGAHLEGASLSQAHLAGANLSGAYLQSATLSHARLEGVFLYQAHLESARLYQAHLQGAFLYRARLEGAIVEGAFLQDAALDEAYLNDAFLDGAHLEHAVLSQAHLQGATLIGAHLQGATLIQAHLERADLTGAQLQGARLSEAHLEDAALSYAHLEGARLVEAHLRDANLSRAHLKAARLDDAHLERVRLAEADLAEADLSRAYLMGADLHAAHLVGATLDAARLQRAVLAQVDLSGASLVGAHLEGSDLRAAHLAGATLTSAHLTGARITQAYLENANLTATHLEGARLSEAHLERATLVEAHLEATDLSSARLEGAILTAADLAGSHLVDAHLEGATLRAARLAGKEIAGKEMAEIREWVPDFPQALPPADLRLAYFDLATALNDIILGDSTCGYVALADARWSGVNLAVVALPPAHLLGDERLARRELDAQGKPKDRGTRLDEFEAAARANRQLAVTLRAHGLSDHAARFAYRAQVLQREVLRRQRKLGAYLFSLVLDRLVGYGFKPARILVIYGLTLLIFAAAYFSAGMWLGGMHLAWYQSLLVSMTAIHGRVFFSNFGLNSLQSWVAAAESVVGIVIEGVFVGTVIQRLFG